jgi:hypothetical protein
VEKRRFEAAKLRKQLRQELTARFEAASRPEPAEEGGFDE